MGGWIARLIVFILAAVALPLAFYQCFLCY